MARRPSRAAAKRAAPSIAAVVAEVEARGRPRRLPGRAVAVVPLQEWKRLQALAERVAEDEADAKTFLAHENEPGAWRPWREIRQNLGL